MKRVLHDIVRECWRWPLRTYMKHKIKKDNVRILSSNCVGGCLLHDVKRSFLSPTVNLIIDDMDFIKLVYNPEHYLKIEPIFYHISKWGFPVAKIDDIIVHCVHYNTFGEFKKAWCRRCMRFLEHQDKEILVMATDSQLKTEEAIQAFHDLSYRKVCFTAKNNIPYKEFVYVPGYEKSGTTGDINRYCDCKGTRIFEKYFDCISFING